MQFLKERRSMKWNKLYKYPKSTRSLIEGNRHYDVSNEILPSVTTILKETQSDEKKASLFKWRQKVGENEAERIRDEAARRGTAMHEFLEMHLNGTCIDQGVILMCSKDGFFQKFTSNGAEFTRFKHKFLSKIDQFYQKK
jgi:hypothetical protein